MHLIDSFIREYNGKFEYINNNKSDVFLYNVKLKPEVFGQEFIEQYEGSTFNIGIYVSKCKIELWSSSNNFSDPILNTEFKVNLK